MMNTANYSQQRGVALIVCMILLVVIAFMGLSTIQSSTLETKMAKADFERQEAFYVAEAALVHAESLVKDTPWVDQNYWSAGCSGECFTNTCANGRCFTGTYVSGNSRFACAKGAAMWKTQGVWDTANLHQTYTMTYDDTAGAKQQLVAKYIIEFDCFIAKEGQTFALSSPENQNGDPLFRITALGSSRVASGSTDEGASTVMLQTTYRKL